jgi:hypothetical protein
MSSARWMLSTGNVHRVQRCSSFPCVWCSLAKSSFLFHRNCSPDEISSIRLVQDNRELYPQTHSGKLSKNELPGSFRQWTVVAFMRNTSLHLTADNWRTVFRNPVELYWIPAINKYFNIGCLTFRSLCMTKSLSPCLFMHLCVVIYLFVYLFIIVYTYLCNYLSVELCMCVRVFYLKHVSVTWTLREISQNVFNPLSGVGYKINWM